MTVTLKTTRFAGGFTLLELIVAIALMDVIAVALYSSMYAGFKAKRASQSALRPFQSVAPTFEFIRQDLASAVQPDGILAGVFTGEDDPGIEDRDTDTLSFCTAGYLPVDDEISSNIVRIGYELDTDSRRDEIVLKRMITRNLLSPTETDPDEEIICRNIAGLDAAYYDGTDWLERWDSSEQSGQLPRGVKITLTFFDEDNTDGIDDGLRSFTRIFRLMSTPQSNENQGDSHSGE